MSGDAFETVRAAMNTCSCPQEPCVHSRGFEAVGNIQVALANATRSMNLALEERGRALAERDSYKSRLSTALTEQEDVRKARDNWRRAHDTAKAAQERAEAERDEALKDAHETRGYRDKWAERASQAEAEVGVLRAEVEGLMQKLNKLRSEWEGELAMVWNVVVEKCATLVEERGQVVHGAVNPQLTAEAIRKLRK